MPTKLETARAIAKNLLEKEEEVVVLKGTLERIAERTDPDGNIKVLLDDKSVLVLPASIITDVFLGKKSEREAELDIIADKFNGKSN